MKNLKETEGYKYTDSEQSHAHGYLLPTVTEELQKHFVHTSTNKQTNNKLFDLGCGNGSVATYLTQLGYTVLGVDPSVEGIAQANTSYPELQLETGSAYDDLATKYGKFPAVVSLEVVEHVYAPRDYAATLFSLVEPGGVAIVSTPYHGYFKNLVMAATGKMDQHFTVLWDHGHIKFWSFKTLSELLTEAGFESVRFRRVGRFPALAKSMIAIATAPIR